VCNAQVLLDNLDSKVFYRQGHATAEYLERELDKTSKFSRSQSSREGGYDTQGLSEQPVPRFCQLSLHLGFLRCDW
jgi:hypothetical protein